MEKFDVVDVVKNGYFLIDWGESSKVSYHMMQFFEDEDELLTYINGEYRGTVADEVAKFTLEELMEGQTYSLGRRQGTGQAEMNIILIHGDNWKSLDRYLDSATVFYRDGEQVVLSELLHKAKSVQRIRDVVEIYNCSWDNYW